MILKDWLTAATARLQDAAIPSPSLDAAIILAHTLRRSRTYLHAHDDETLTPQQYEIAEARLQLRLDRTPIAYIIGHKEFYGRQFQVTTATLIPRPESETIIELLVEHEAAQSLLPTTKRLVDVGTGSGCLGITAKCELPDLDVTLLDISNHALRVAQQNATRLGANVHALRSDLLSVYPYNADYILANLPYVDPEWERSPETSHEPELALFADDNGLSLINKLLEQAPLRLTPQGVILIEADPRQHAAIITNGKQHGFTHHVTRSFIVCLHRSA